MNINVVAVVGIASIVILALGAYMVIIKLNNKKKKIKKGDV